MRHPIQRAHGYPHKVALDTIDGLFLNPLVGSPRSNDVPIATRIRAYEGLLESVSGLATHGAAGARPKMERQLARAYAVGLALSAPVVRVPWVSWAGIGALILVPGVAPRSRPSRHGVQLTRGSSVRSCWRW